MKIKVTAPTRLSLFGGGTDTNPYAQKYGGICINFAINIYQEFVFDTKQRSKSYIQDADPHFYEAFFKKYDYQGGMKQEFDNNIHSGSGSSASAAVCLVAGLSRIIGEKLDKRQIAEKAWEIEVGDLGMYGGKQDQYATSYGGFNKFVFGNKINTTPYPKSLSGFIERSVVLFDTNIKRDNPKLQNNLKNLTQERRQALDDIKLIANKADKYILTRDIKGLGKILHSSWEAKKRSNNISNKEIDNLYDLAVGQGALGGKLCGSGGGGYIIFIVEDKFKNKVIKKLEKHGAKWVDYSIDHNGVMTRFL